MSDIGDQDPVVPPKRPAAKRPPAAATKAKAAPKTAKAPAKARAKAVAKTPTKATAKAAKAPAKTTGRTAKAATRAPRTPRTPLTAPDQPDDTVTLGVEADVAPAPATEPPEPPSAPEPMITPVPEPPPPGREPPPGAPPPPPPGPPPSGPPPSWGAPPSYPSPPSYAPPPPPSGAYPSPSYPPPAHGPPGAPGPKTKTDGVAIAAVVLGIVSIFFFVAFGVFAIVGLILSILALRRTKRPGVGGRGLAIGGLITSIFGLLFSIGFVIAVFWAADNLDHVSWDEVSVGDCVDEDTGFKVLVAPCFVAHEAEVYAVVTTGLPDEAPTDDDLDTLFDQFCRERFESYVGISYDDSIYSSSIVTTPADEWESGNRAVVCVIQNEDGSPLEGSVRNSGE